MTVSLADGGSETNTFELDALRTVKLFTIVFVYVLGMASKNHNPRPFRKPLPSALTMFFTSQPSKRATPTLRTVLDTRKKECRMRMKISFECHDGKAMRRMAISWRRKPLFRPGLSCEETAGKYATSDFSLDCGVGLMFTYVDNIRQSI